VGYIIILPANTKVIFARYNIFKGDVMVATLNISPSLQYRSRKNIYKRALSTLYSKKEIWNQLKAERYLRQKDEALKKSRFLFYKKIYTIDNEKYYKVIGLDKHYYITVDSLNYISSSQLTVQLYYYTVNGMKCKKSLLRTDKTKDEILISKSTLNIVFDPCRFESIS